MSEQPIAFEEVPDNRTSQQAIDQPQRERIAYEELQSGDVIQEGDEWQHESGRWKPFASLDGSRVQVRHTQRARRPYSIRTIQEIADAMANAQKAATQLQDERDELREALAAEQLTHKYTTMSSADALRERDEALAEVAKLSAEVWARKPLEERLASLLEELAQARAECNRLKGLIDDLLNEPTARQVQGMLRTWATELDWSAGCFDSLGREQIDTIQKTLIAVMERIETMIHPEGGTDDN